jgi:hypothetical protein
MILDVTLKNEAYFLKINKKFFQNKSTPISLFQTDSPLMKKYSYLGFFHIDNLSFGFNGCFQKQEEDNNYILYRFDFPEINNLIAIRRMLLTIYLSTYYVVETMFYDKEFFSETIWDDQSLSFIVFDGNRKINGYSIGGQIYPWFKKKLSSLDDKQLANLNEYVHFELNRISKYFFSKELSFGQITISKNHFFIQVNIDGRWLSWNENSFITDKPEEFSSHNIDFCSDQELCFAAIIAINTWLREN